MPHFEHVIVLAFAAVTAGVLTDAVIGACTTSSRSGNGQRVTDDMHTSDDIDPDEPVNVPLLFAVERSQAVPQSWRLNDTAFQNM